MHYGIDQAIIHQMIQTLLFIMHRICTNVTYLFALSNNTQQEMERNTENALKGVKRMILTLRMFGIYIKPCGYSKLKKLHILYCTLVVIYAAFSAIRSVVLLCFDINTGVRVPFALTIINIFLILVAINTCHGKLVAVLDNCFEFLRHDILSSKVKRKFYILCNIVSCGCVIVYTMLLLIFLILAIFFDKLCDEAYLVLLYPLDAASISQAASYAIIILSNVVIVTSYATVAFIPCMNMCITYIEIHLFRSFNVQVEKVVNIKNSPHGGIATNLEVLRHMHLSLTKLVQQHNDMFKFPTAVYFAATVAVTCLAFYMLASASNVMGFSVVLLQLLFWLGSSSIILWSGISLNNEVSCFLLVEIHLLK